MILFADEVEVADRIEWVGRLLTVERIRVDESNRRRPGRYFTGTLDNGDPKRLHYFDHEQVRVAE